MLDPNVPPVSAESAAITSELRVMLAERGLTVGEVTDGAGLQRRTARDVNRGTHEWTVAEMRRVARVLNPDDPEEESSRLASIAFATSD
ncbi:hypothetical protein F6B41_02820 [Microbacterium lushaniae]|nr:hypothetical protein F6B41_28465 [Microbacterium lushaniae]KAA9158837.1 hypothetical protein F6B41_02820 [Microbacterium lushaniae]